MKAFQNDVPVPFIILELNNALQELKKHLMESSIVLQSNDNIVCDYYFLINFLMKFLLRPFIYIYIAIK